MAQSVSRRPVTAEAWVWFRSVPVGFVVDTVALGQVLPRVLRFYPVSFIPQVVYYAGKWKEANRLHHRVAQ
jgi:hypothetical protein